MDIRGYVLIDSDQTFPPDALDELVLSGKDIMGFVIRASRQECLNVGELYPDRPLQQNAFKEENTQKMIFSELVG